MGQLFCKEDCCEGRFKKSAVATWDGEDASWQFDERGTHSTVVNTSLRSSPSSSHLDPKRSNRIKHKKRSVALHAEFRDRQGMILAPPLVTETVMEDTDNVFSGQDLGVDTLNSNGDESSIGLFGGIPQDSMRNAQFGRGSAAEPNNIVAIADSGGQQLITVEKSPEEDAFLDKALAEDDNFIFDGMSAHFRQKLKDSMERVIVPSNTLLIRKGDDPDYLYLILEGEVAVYIDPDEYMDAGETGHALKDISLSQRSVISSVSQKGGHVKREFKQSYVVSMSLMTFHIIIFNLPL